MCTNGVNTNQLKANVEQIDEVIALSRRWTHRAYHLADDAQFERSSKKLAEIQALLDEVRSQFDELEDLIDKDDAEFSSGTVNLV
ncbi:MAG: dynein gamma chain protein [Coriobacteriia bacterium]|nr:dynein gamma chain protein [Coriobacteriia bacterium]